MGIFLNAGKLISDSATIGDYKIEWRKDSSSGTIVFISGEGTDITLQAQHPLVNEVVSSGTLYPVIVYVYVDGVRITSEQEIDVIFSPGLKNCLEVMIIENIDCSSQRLADKWYSFKLPYLNQINISENKSRTLKYYIGADIAYLAWRFDAKNIADGIKTYYCTAADSNGVLIDNFITGVYSSSNIQLIEDIMPVDYPISPTIIHKNQTLKYQPLAMVIDFSPFTYSVGDYIKIEIIGSVLDPSNNNTDWELKLKCLTSLDLTQYNTQNVARYDASVRPTMNYIQSPCNYGITYKRLEKAKELYQVPMLTYITFTTNWVGNGGGIGNTNMDGDIGSKNGVPWSFGASYGMERGIYPVCQNLPIGEQIIYDYNVSGLLITLPNNTEYQKFVDGIAYADASASFILARTLTPQDYKYYASYSLDILLGVSCGDTLAHNRNHIFHTTVITYDSVLKTIHFTRPTITNQIPGVHSCENPKNTIDQFVTGINIVANFIKTETTNVTASIPVNIGSINTVSISYTTVVTKKWYSLPAKIYEHILSPTDMINLGFCLNSSGVQWERFIQYDRLTLTDTTSNETRMENWTLERQAGLETGSCIDESNLETNWELVYTSIPPATKGSTVLVGTLTNATP